MAAVLKRRKLLNVACVRGSSVFQCMGLIERKVADTINLKAEEIYVAGKLFHLKLLLFEKLANFNGRFTDDAVVVIRRDQDFKKGLADLRGKSLCLSGSSTQNLQYQALLNVLLPLGFMKVVKGECDTPIPSMAAYFGPSCVPGTWSLNETSHKVFSTLCQSCHSVCTDQDFYGGTDGALRCLRAEAGHVALTSTATLSRSPVSPEKFQRLCIQGVRRPLNDTCSWLGRRPNALLISPKTPTEKAREWREAILKVFHKFRSEPEEAVPWFRGLLFSDDVISDLINPLGQDTFQTYLGQVFTRSMETPFPKLDCGAPRTLKWCVVMPKNVRKCKEMAAAFATHRLKPKISCIQARTQAVCSRWLANNKAHITVLSPVDAVSAERDFHLTPVAAESSTHSQGSYLVGVAKG